jgi:ribosome biogenesis protein NSA1
MGLSRLGSEDHLLTACNAQGIVSVLSLRRDSKIPVVRRFSTLGTSTTTKDPQYSVACCMGVNEAKKWVAVGGKDRETSIYDVESAARVWKTKNLAPDPQTLLQPITWPSAIHFLRDPDRMVVGNGLQVRLYDVRADSIQRRPVAYTPPGLLEQRVTCFSQTGEHALVVADTAGYLLSLDLRNLKSATTQARYVGPAGSVRQLAVHSKLPRMAAVGLDRMLHLYDTKTCRPLACMYLKQRLNCVLMDDEANYSNDGDRCYAEDDTVVDGRSLDQEDDVRDYMDSDQEQEGSNASHHESEASHDDESSVGRGNQTSSDDDEDEDDGTEESAEEIYTERHSKRQRK